MSGDLLDLETFLPYRLNRLAEAVSREFARTYKSRFDLSRSEWRVLAGLGQYGTMTAKALGAQSAMHKTKVSRAVAELERRRWLTRTPDAADRRMEHLALSKAGRRIFDELAPIAAAYNKHLLAVITADQVDAFCGALHRLETALAERS